MVGMSVIEQDVRYIFVGLFVVGSSVSLISVPVMSEMIEATEQDCEEKFDPEDVSNIVSSLFVTATGIGFLIGPTLASILVKLYSFCTAQEILASAVLVFALLYLLFTVVFTSPGRAAERSFSPYRE